MSKDLLKRIETKSHHSKGGLTELHLSGKEIGSHISTIGATLVHCIQAGAIRLSALHLDHNDLTTDALPVLSDVIRSAAEDLQYLDLQDNHICAKTDDDLDDWLIFLRCLSCCRDLHVLTLSRNPLGNRAIEMMAMIFCRERAIGLESLFLIERPSTATHIVSDPAQCTDSEIYLTGFQTSDGNFTRSKNSSATSIAAHTIESDEYELSDEYEVSRTPSEHHVGGLRGLTSLSLEETHLSDAGALQLSYIAERFLYRKDLTRVEEQPTERTKFEKKVPTFEKPDLSPVVSIDGLRYDGNDFSISAIRMLEVAGSLLAISPDYGSMHSTISTPRKRSSTATSSHSPSMRRKPSMSDDSLSRCSLTSTSMTELERSRTKLQSTVLKDRNPVTSRVELWTASLSVLEFLRIVCSSDGTPNLGHIPTDIWRTIATQGCDRHRVLLDTQIDNIQRWATNAECLAVEQSWNRKMPHVQIWKLLEALDCLAYENLP